MKLATRSWLSGALLPALVMAAASAVAGQVFRAALESALDRALLAQAATESVSLFDGGKGPHLHMESSPLLDEVRPFAPTGALFGPDGTLVAHFPPLGHDEPILPAPPTKGPSREFATREEGAVRTRELIARVDDGTGRQYALRLSASLAQVDASVSAFHFTAALMVGVAGLVLAVLQALWGRQLSRRLASLSSHLERLRRGERALVVPPDAGDDEVSELRAVLSETTTQLERARQVQDRLLADAAHELRTPLTLMRTTLDLALRRERSGEELRQALTDARAEVERLTALASALLDMAAAGRSWDLSLGNLATCVEEAAEGARAAAEEAGVWLEVECERPAETRFNSTAMRQALDNLLSNALRFAPKGTAIQVNLRRHGAGWRLSVRDRGPGIPEAQREAVFAPFHRGDARGGSGLGLAIVSEVMRLHGGRAFASSPDDGAGAQVVLELP